MSANPETTTTLSKDCRTLYVRTIVLQDGTKQDAPKTQAGIREIDIHPDIAFILKELIGLRTSGYLFCTKSGKPILYANLRKNVFDPILCGHERKKMKRVGKGWKQVGVEKFPGVLPEKAKEEGGYGFHSFRRFRETHLRLEGVPQPIIDFWIGHGKKTISDVYTKVKGETTKRRDWCEKAGLGFKLPVPKVTEIKTAGKTAKKGKAA
jgi:integrase